MQTHWTYQHQSDSDLDIREVRMSVSNDSDRPMQTGKPASISTMIYARQPLKACAIAIAIQDASLDNERVLNLSSEQQQEFFDLPAGRSVVQLSLPALGLRAGAYSAKIRIHRGMLDTLDVIENIGFRVDSDQVLHDSMFYQEHHWSVAVDSSRTSS